MADPASDFGSGLATQAQNDAKSAINSFNPTDTASNQLGRLNSLIGSQAGQSTNYAQQYADTIAKNPSVTSLYNQGNAQFNVPQLSQQATYLNNQVSQATPQAYQLAKGFDYSDPQVQNQVNTNLRFLQPAANAATANAQQAQNLAGQFVQAGQAQNAQNLLPVQSQGQFLLQQQAAQQTGYTQENSNELSALIAKMNSGVALSSAEMERANTLATQETSYQNALTAQSQAQNVAKLNNQYKSVPAGSSLLNTFANTAINPGMLTSGTGVATYGR
jgi:hypothetical protein